MFQNIRDSITRYTELGWTVLPVSIKLDEDDQKVFDGLLRWKGRRKERFTPKFSMKRLEQLGDKANGLVLFTGHRGNVLVVDIDSTDHEAVLREIGLSIPPDTVSAKTRRGGRHYFFLHPKKLTHTTISKLLDKPVDVRGAKGMIILPPTCIENSRYEWIVSPENGVIRNPPDELVRLIRKHNRQKKVKLPDESVMHSPVGKCGAYKLSKKQKAILNERLDQARNARVGDRSEKDFWVVEWAIKIGIDKESIYEIVKNVGKFKERGREYFNAVYKKVLNRVNKKHR